MLMNITRLVRVKQAEHGSFSEHEMRFSPEVRVSRMLSTTSKLESWQQVQCIGLDLVDITLLVSNLLILADLWHRFSTSSRLD